MICASSWLYRRFFVRCKLRCIWKIVLKVSFLHTSNMVAVIIKLLNNYRYGIEKFIARNLMLKRGRDEIHTYATVTLMGRLINNQIR